MTETTPFNWKERAGIALLVLSFISFWSILGVPWLDGTTAEKAYIAGALAIGGEVIFWIGVLVAGRDFMKRYQPKFSWQRVKEEWLRNARGEDEEGRDRAVGANDRPAGGPPADAIDDESRPAATQRESTAIEASTSAARTAVASEQTPPSLDGSQQPPQSPPRDK